MKNLFNIFFVSAFLLGMIGCEKMDFNGDNQAIVDSRLVRAKKFYEQRDYKAAISSYEEVLRVQPKYSDAYFQIALIYDRNLNDYLNAAYYYQRFLGAAGHDTSKDDLAKGFFENAKLQFAASVPNVGGQTSPDLVKLKTENNALHKQVEDLKREIMNNRSKPGTATKSSTEKPVAVAITQPTVSTKTESKPPPSQPAHPKTYTVKKGEGIQSIAEKLYGDKGKWREIIAVNPQIKDANRLMPGQVLNLPQ